MSEQYDVIIIGAGIGGLTAGNILAKNGMKVLILEKNHVPGGAVTTFYRNGYPIDISHAFCALKDGAFAHKLFKYINILPKLELIELEKAFIYFSETKKEPIFCFSDIGRYKNELASHFPHERNNIDRFLRDSTHIWDKEVLKSYYNPSLIRLLSYPLLFNRLFRYKDHTFDQYLSRFTKNEELKEVISAGWPYLGLERNFVSALYMICLFNAYHKEKAYFVKGGIGKISAVMADNFISLGGNIRYGITASRVILNRKRSASGVMDDKNNSYLGKKIASNADSKKTFLELVYSKNIPKRFIDRIKRLSVSCSCIQVHFIAEANIGDEYLSCGSIVLPFHLDLEKRIRALLKAENYPHANPLLLISIHPLSSFGIKDKLFNFNVVWFTPNHALWKKVRELFGEEVYQELKNEVASLIEQELKKTWSIISVKFTNILTPLSMERWLGATEGAIYDLASSPRQMLLNRLKNVTYLKNFYLVGAKTFPGAGIAGATFSALALSDTLLRRKLTNRRLSL